MHEMLTGSHPFQRETAPEMQTAVLREDPIPLGRAVPGVSPSIVRVIERCLDKQPSQRPESARDVAMFLEALGDPSPTSVRPFDDGPARRLRIRLAAASAGLLLLALATWGYVRVATERAAREILASELLRAERVTRYVHDDQRARIGLTALLFASFPDLKAAFDTDFATVRDFLLQYQQRIPGQPLLVAIRPNGTVLARTDETAAQPTAQGNEWLDGLLAAPGSASVVAIGRRPGVAVALPLEAAGTVFGYLVAAEAIDQRFADAVSEATQDEIVVLSDGAILATTLRSAQNPWRSLGEWRAAGGGTEGTIEVRIGTQAYLAREVSLAQAPAVSAIIVRSRDEAFAPYRRVQKGLMLIALILVAGAVSSALWLPRLLTRRAARGVSRPAQRS
jgi:hypothetical protein